MGTLPGIDLTGHASPAMADLDGDGWADLVTGETSGQIRFFRNAGNPDSLQFIPWTNQNLFAVVDSRSAPCLTDLDGDGDMDLLLGSEYNNVQVLRNLGTATQPDFSQEETIGFPHLGKNTNVTAWELTGPGETHLLVGISTGGMYHLSRITCTDGDMNGDGTLDILDVVQLADAILSGIPLPGNGPCSSDMNGDGQVDVLDAVMLVYQILGARE